MKNIGFLERLKYFRIYPEIQFKSIHQVQSTVLLSVVWPYVGENETIVAKAIVVCFSLMNIWPCIKQ